MMRKREIRLGYFEIHGYGVIALFIRMDLSDSQDGGVGGNNACFVHEGCAVVFVDVCAGVCAAIVDCEGCCAVVVSAWVN